MRTFKAYTVGGLIGLGLSVAQAQSPLSAIDWLNQLPTVEAPIAPVIPQEPAVSKGITSHTITVTPLDAPSSDAVGLLPRSVSGLPAKFWGPSTTEELADLLNDIDSTDLLPATRDLLFTILLAELDAPIDSTGVGAFFLMRIDTLARLGAVESAQALLLRAGADSPDRFNRWFDLSLLLGTENAACEQLKTSPGLTTSLAARVFCLARTGDWNAAALSFGTARALGQIGEDEEALLLRYLDDDLSDSSERLATPIAPTPLTFQLFEAIGEPLATTTLPIAFAHADLRANTGWKAQIEAAERLARKGAIPANKLLGLYTENRPAASGGVWNRVAALQAFDLSLASGSEDAIAKSLPVAWAEMQGEGLEPVFAEIYSDRIKDIPRSGAVGALAFRMALLTKYYETAAQQFQTTLPEENFLKAVAQGDLSPVKPIGERMEAIQEGFTAKEISPRFQSLLDDGALGAALLQGIALLGDGARGDVAKLSEAITLFRMMGLEDVARRASLQVMILDQRG